MGIALNYILINISLLAGLSIQTNVILYANVILIYLYIAGLVWWKVENLSQFHLDQSSISAVIFFSFFRTGLGIQNEEIYSWVILMVTLVILMGCVKNWHSIPKTRWSWVGISLLCVILVIPISVVESLQYSAMKSAANPVMILIEKIFDNLSFVTLIEEIMFRGILWKYLRNLGFREDTAFWGQAIVFWLFHAWKIVGTPISFFITIPMTTLAVSFLVYKSKQVFPSIVLHTLLNSLIPFGLYYFFLHPAG